MLKHSETGSTKNMTDLPYSGACMCQSQKVVRRYLACNNNRT